MMKYLFIILTFIFSVSLKAQYNFSETKIIECSSVKSQDKTGTCWCFATSSFLESELIHSGKKPIDISEMYLVKTIYKDKARNYILRQGKTNFAQGALAHDVIRAVELGGIIPEEIYNGRPENKAFDHNELEAAMKGFLDGVLQTKKPSSLWPKALDKILDVYIGNTPETFNYEGKSFTSQQLASSLGINSKDYIELSSFTHHSFFKSFILEVPDNYSNGSYYNIPLDDMIAAIDYALASGYTISWDGDVSNPNFSSKESIAIVPLEADRKDKFETPGTEKTISQDDRQIAFESLQTTDDHLMHLVGTTKDQNGTKYYIVKNSWGEVGIKKGFVYMSESYIRLNTISIMMNKKALIPSLSSKFNQ